jgi:hypothetical protein
MSKNKSSTETNKFLKEALKELDALVPKEEPAGRKALPSAGKTSVPKKKIVKAVKEVSKKKTKKADKPKKAPFKIKRLDDDSISDNIIVMNPPPPVAEPEKKEDVIGKTKVVIKDGIVIVQLDE